MSKELRVFVCIAAVIGGLVLADRLLTYQDTGNFFATDIVEELEDPVAVQGWSADGLKLADGRTVQLPGFSALPEESQVLEKATERGVEVGADGRVTGLMKIRHSGWNDPVDKHIARVDLAYLLMYTHEGEYADPPREPMEWPQEMLESRRKFWPDGWGAGNFNWYQDYAERADWSN